MQVLRDNLIPVNNADEISDFSRSVSIDLMAMEKDIDGLGHMNNAVYVNWLDQAHLIHTFNLGITPQVMESTGCGLVVRHTDLTYFSALRENDTARVGTCIVRCDGKLRMRRQFQMIRRHDLVTLLRGVIDYISIDFRTGRPRRMPGIFGEALTRAVVVPEKSY